MMSHWEVDPSDFVDTPPDPEDAALTDREIAGYYDRDDGYAHLDELLPFSDRDPF